ncbi:MAG TPA: zincin-like metallopeptidase domain-containing protein [Rhizomicrobium sp.]
MRKTETPREDVYTRVTAKIVADLEKGVRTWLKPWSVSHSAGRITRPLRANGKPYNGINVITLWADSVAKEFSSPVWMTFKQALELGACVKKGEKGSPVVYADKMKRSEQNAAGEETERDIPFLKAYTVFNSEQIEGLPAHFYAAAPPNAAKIERIEHAEEFVRATNANIVHGGSRACYVVSTDNIHMPCIDFFRDSESYYATLLHELTHWTRHETRLNREFGRKRWGDEGYAAEELVAELGSAFLCADLGITPEPREDHAAYIASWLEVLKNDKRAIFTAAAYAQRAAEFLFSRR